MDRHCCRRVDDMRLCAPGGQDVAQPFDRRSVLVVAGADGGRRFFVDGVWLFYRQSFSVPGQHFHAALPTGSAVCERFRA